MKIIAIIPAYNVEKTIGEVVKRTLSHVDAVIVVDDGSIDSTAVEAAESGAKVISLERNTGKANATKVGIAECDGFEVVVTLDGDLQHCPEEIPRLLEEVKNGAHICIGSRFYNDHSSMPFGNMVSNRVASKLINMLSGVELSDVQSGFRAIEANAAHKLELVANRYAIEHIMILEAAKKGYKITEAPVSCIYGDEKSNIRVFKDTFRVTYDVLRFMLR